MIRARKAAATAYFDDDSEDGTAAPTWIMGLPYTELREEERRSDVFSTMWITYRSGFTKMEPYGYTDDSGWGCMLRSAQMLMSQALQRHSLGRSWRVPRTLEERLRIPEYRRLLQLFADHPGEDSLFSIHNMCQVGIRYDKLPGEWYGPTTAACVVRDIAELYANKPIPPPPPLRTSLRCPPPTETNTSPPSSESAGSNRTNGSADQNPATDFSLLETDNGNHSAASDAGSLKAEAGDYRKPVDINGKSIGVGVSEGGRCNARDSERPDADAIAAGSGSSGVAPSGPRPLRVFVSQGDVVYIDEVDTMALRGVSPESGKITNGSAKRRAKEGDIAGKDGLSTDDGEEQPTGNRNADENGLLTGQEGPGEGSRGESSIRSCPAFFDPLLNPGDGHARGKEKEPWASAVVLLVPLRLGLDELSAGYIPGLLGMLQVPQSLGFLGGRPNHATFWIGAQGEVLTGLDPHTTQAAPEMSARFPSERYMHSLHCHYPVSMDIRRVDPSLALAFYLPDRASFEDLTKRIRETKPPPFSVEQTRPDYEGEMGLAFMINQKDDDGITDDEEDEYVFVKGPER